MIDFLKQKDNNRWYVYSAGKVLAICEIGNNFPLTSFTKDAKNLLPSMIALIAKGIDILHTTKNCGDNCKITLMDRDRDMEGDHIVIVSVEVEKSFTLKKTDKGILGKGIKPLSEEDYWKPV